MSDTASVRPATVKHYVETIFYIRHEEGKVRPGRLAEWMGVSAPTVTVTLRRLARDGWVSLGADHSVELTAQGEDTYDLVRDVIADLGLGLVRMEQRRHHISEVFKDDADSGAQRKEAVGHGN